MEVKRIGNLYGEDRGTGFAGNVWDKFQLCPTLTTMQGGGREPMIVEDFYANREPRTYGKIAPTIRAEREGLKVIEDAKTTRGADVVSTIRASYYKTGERNIRENIERKRIRPLIEAQCVAMRGRGENNEQQLEPNTQGVDNALTTVQKDNLVMEKNIVIDIYNNKKIDGEVCGTITAHGNASSTTCGTFGIVEKEKINKVGQISNEGSQCGTVVSDEGLSPTLSAGTHGYANAHVCTRYRIRKLTEKECFRLMGFKDSDFEKARAVNSATQIYKQAGNSIVKQVLMAIFLQMNIQGLKPWNDRNEDEIRELIK